MVLRRGIRRIKPQLHPLRYRAVLPAIHNRIVSSSQHRCSHNAQPQYHQHAPTTAVAVDPPTGESLRQYFIAKAVPMIGFGIMDQTLMLQAGNAIDCTLGVALGLSTLSAAAFGQIVSNAGSVLFGGAVERAANAMGFPTPHFTATQKQLPIVQRTALMGTLFGVILGCTLGLVNLLFIDTYRTQERKLAAASPVSYEIEASNSVHEESTVVTVRGPDRKGLLAAITNVFRDEEMCLVEVSASRSRASPPRGDEPSDLNYQYIVEDVFVVQHHDNQLSDDQLQHIIQALQGATDKVASPLPVKDPPLEHLEHSAPTRSDSLATAMHN